MKLNKMKQKGFTMIELVIVIAILGILAAFALPRFANFTQDSQKAAITNITGSLNAALGIVKAKFVAQGSTGTTVDLDGNSTTTNDVIPITSSGDLNMTVGAASLESCTNLVNGLLSNTNGLNIGVGVNACYVHIRGPISYSIRIGSDGITNNVY